MPVVASPVQQVLMQGPVRHMASGGSEPSEGQGADGLYSAELKVSLGASVERSMPAASTFMYTEHGDGSCVHTQNGISDHTRKSSLLRDCALQWRPRRHIHRKSASQRRH